MAHFQPMFALDFEGLISSKSELHRMREIHNGILLKSIPFDVRKSTIALFMAEVLYRLIGESEENRELFEFIWGSVEALDSLNEGVANFHLWFLANISHFLGFSPGNEYHEGDWFDMREGLYTDVMPLHDEACKPESAQLLGGAGRDCPITLATCRDADPACQLLLYPPRLNPPSRIHTYSTRGVLRCR